MERNNMLAVTTEMIDAAKANPRGWIEKITPSLVARPRAETVIGAWKVDANGDFTGLVILNPRYLPL